MTDPNWRDGEVSIFALGTMVLRNRWKIMRWSLAGGVLAAIIALFSPPEYTATASFIPQGTDISRSGLASLAGQFGLSLPTSSQSLSADFYAQLLKSRTILLPIARDSFAVPEMGARNVAFASLFKIGGSSPAQRTERGFQRLEKIVGTSVGQKTGVVGLSVSTKWPSVSLGIISSLVTAVDDFNLKTRQGQAAAERKFVEGRLAVATSDLRAAEDRLQTFLQQNREFLRSPELKFAHDRLQRDLDLQQQVFTSLTQSLEEVRLREIRDTPVITIVEPPSVQTLPDSRQRVLHVILGLILGAFLGAMVSFASEAVRRRKREGDIEAVEFADTLGEVKGEILAPVRTLKQRIRH